MKLPLMFSAKMRNGKTKHKDNNRHKDSEIIINFIVEKVDLSVLTIWISPFLVLSVSSGCFHFIAFYTHFCMRIV